MVPDDLLDFNFPPPQLNISAVKPDSLNSSLIQAKQPAPSTAAVIDESFLNQIYESDRQLLEQIRQQNSEIRMQI